MVTILAKGRAMWNRIDKEFSELNEVLQTDGLEHKGIAFCEVHSKTESLRISQLMKKLQWRNEFTLLASILFILAGCNTNSVQSYYLESEQQNVNYLAYSLPKTLIKFNISGDNTKKSAKVSPASVEFVSDPQAKYRLSFNYRATSDDEFNVEIGKDGLLNSAKVVNEDKTPEIISGVVSLAGDLAGIRSGGPAIPSYSVDLAFDPHDPKQVVYAQKLALSHGFRIVLKDIEGQFLYANNNINPSSSLALQDEIRFVAAQCNDSLCFRTLKPIILEVSNKGSNLISRQILEVADITRVNSFNIQRSACVKRTNDLTFTDGVLTKVKVIKPSEILGCMSIPADIVKAIIGLG